MSNEIALPDILTVSEVATYLRVSETPVWRWCVSGRLPAFRIGRSWRIRRAELQEYISRITNEAEVTDRDKDVLDK